MSASAVRTRVASVLRARRAGLRADADRGISLSELLVTIMVFGIVLAVSTAAFVSMARATSTARSVDAGTREVSNGMNALAQTVRSAADVPVSGAPDAPAFRSATAESVSLSTSVNFGDTRARPTLVTYTLDAQRRLREERVDAQLAGSFWRFPTGAPSSSRVLTAPLAPAGATPVFRYLDRAGAPLPADRTGALAEAQRKEVAFVEITLVSASDRAGGPTVTLRNTVGTPNLQR